MNQAKFPAPTHRRMWRLSRMLRRHPHLTESFTIGAAAHRALRENT